MRITLSSPRALPGPGLCQGLAVISISHPHFRHLNGRHSPSPFFCALPGPGLHLLCRQSGGWGGACASGGCAAGASTASAAGCAAGCVCADGANGHGGEDFGQFVSTVACPVDYLMVLTHHLLP
eukprot:scaffold22732_cov17-Tisochrysis_lutea.AAC.2